MALNHCKAIWRVLRSDTWVGKLLGGPQLGFVVTKKGEGPESPSHWGVAWALIRRHLWPWLLFAAAAVAGLGYFIYLCVAEPWSTAEIMVSCTAILWMLFTLM